MASIASFDPSEDIAFDLEAYGTARPDQYEIEQAFAEAVIPKTLPKKATEVRDILGTSLLTDVFHADRWDYVFTIRRPGTEPQRRTVVAWFKDDKLDKLDAPELPSEREFVNSISRQRPASAKQPVLELTPEQKDALPRPPKVEAPPADAPPPQRSYPPLEAS